MNTQPSFGPWEWSGNVLSASVAPYDSIIEPECSGSYCGAPVWLNISESNKRLIAAAPDLLCMLQRVMDEICMTECGMSHMAALTLEQARKALDKARGNKEHTHDPR